MTTKASEKLSCVVIAYKDIRGNLHSTLEACNQSNKLYKENKLREDFVREMCHLFWGKGYIAPEFIHQTQNLSYRWEQIKEILDNLHQEKYKD